MCDEQTKQKTINFFSFQKTFIIIQRAALRIYCSLYIARDRDIDNNIFLKFEFIVLSQVLRIFEIIYKVHRIHRQYESSKDNHQYPVYLAGHEVFRYR